MSSKETMDVIETTLDTIENTLDKIETVPAVVKNNPVVVIGVAVISLAVGAGVSAFISNRYFDKKYTEIVEKEVQKARLFYSQRNKEGDFDDPVKLAAKYHENETEDEDETAENDDSVGMAEAIQEAATILEERQYTPYNNLPEINKEEVVEVKTSVRRSNVFSRREPDDAEVEDYDLNEELKKKAAGRPYILDHETYYKNDEDRTLVTLTWYEEDGVLTEDDDATIPNIEGTVGGEDNLRFGYGSNDKNVVLIANDLLDIGYEVVRSRGSYSREVLGVDPNELEHSDGPKVRKMRKTDGY